LETSYYIIITTITITITTPHHTTLHHISCTVSFCISSLIVSYYSFVDANGSGIYNNCTLDYTILVSGGEIITIICRQRRTTIGTIQYSTIQYSSCVMMIYTVLYYIDIMCAVYHITITSSSHHHRIIIIIKHPTQFNFQQPKSFIILAI